MNGLNYILIHRVIVEMPLRMRFMTSRLRPDQGICHLSFVHRLQDGTARIFELHTGKGLSILGGQLGQD